MSTQSTFDYIPDEKEKKPEKPIKPLGAHKPAAESVKPQDAPATTETALAVIEIKKETALSVFTAEKGLDPYLTELEARARAAVAGADETTIAGQAIIRSVAYSLSKSKKPLENMAAELKKDADALIDKVNGERNRGIKFIDDLQTEIRRPLTEYEEKEKTRIGAHKQRLDALLALTTFVEEPTVAAVQARIDTLASDFKDINWQEFTEIAKATRAKVEATISEMLTRLKKAEEDAAELDRLRKEKADREKKEREDKIAADAAESARKEAERIAAEEKAAIEKKAESERAAKQKVIDDQAAALAKAEADKAAAKKKAEDDAAAAARALKDAEDKRVADLKAADEKAERDKAAALKKQQDDAAAAQKAKDDAARKQAAADKLRADNIAHQKKINNAAVAAITKAASIGDFNIPPASAVLIVIAIAKGEIPNVTIKY